MAGDLHTHTNFSDGSSDVELLPVLARRAGMRYLAISDHDTDLSIRYAMQHPVEQGVTLIPAVEMTGFDTRRGRRVHMLCYCPRLFSRVFRRYIKEKKLQFFSTFRDKFRHLC